MSKWPAAALLMATLALLFFGDLLLHPDQTLYSDYSDLITLHLPARRFLVRSWQETGEVPLWCPYNLGGMPFIHDPQVSAFYPFHLPLFLMPEKWMGPALSWLVVLHVIAAGWCMYAYARWRGLSQAGSIVAGIGYMLAGKWLFHILAAGHYNMVPLAWLPLVLLWLEKAIGQRSLWWATWAGAAFSLMILGAYPYLILYSGLFVALWTLGATLMRSEKREARSEAKPVSYSFPESRFSLLASRFLLPSRWALYGAWTLTVACALGAVQLLPSIEGSTFASRSAGVAASPKLLLDGFRSIVGLVGPPLSDEPNCWEHRAGLGLLWLTLAAVAPFAGGKRVRFEAGVCLALLFFGLGGALLVQNLPGFRLFRLPSRMFLVAALPVALLVGRSVDALLDDSPAAQAFRLRCRGMLLRLSTAVLLLAGVFALTIATQRSDLQVRFHPYWASLLLTLPATAWLLGPECRLHCPRARGAAWAALLTVDLATLTWPLVAVRPDSEIYQSSACVRYVAERRDDHGRVLDFNPCSYQTSANHTPLWPGLPAVTEVEPVRGFNPIDVLRYKEFLAFITDDDRPLRPLDEMFTGPILGTFPIKNEGLADLLGIRYLLQPADLPLASTVQTAQPGQSWVEVSEDPEPTTFNFISVAPSGRDCGVQPLPPYRVYENKNVLPRAFQVGEAMPLPDRDQVLRTLKTTDFRRVVLLEGAKDEPGAGPRVGADKHRRSSATILQYLPNRITVDVDGSAGYLVLNDVWFPGWKCEVDGHEVPVYRANYAFRAVPLGAGAKRVVFRFAPDSYAWGKTISALALALLLGINLLGRGRMQRGQAE